MTKVAQVLKFRDGGPSVEEAKRAMIAAGEAPRGMRTRTEAVAAAAEEVIPEQVVPEVAVDENFDDEIEVTPVASSPGATGGNTPRVPAPTAPPAAAPAPARPQVETVETDQFIGKIYQENGKWVGELQYKNGSGTERWVAMSKNALMLDLLKGKGHATLRVKEAVRREKLGGPVFEKNYPLPDDTTAEEFEALPEKQQKIVLRTGATQQVIIFKDAHPEYYSTPENAKRLDDYLRKADVPITARNLEIAFEDLLDSGLLEVRPTAAPSPVITNLSETAPAPAPVRTDSAPAPAVAATVPTEAAPAEPAVVVRKRGSSGLTPGHSSASSGELARPEDGGQPRELSEAELRKLPMSQLKRIADQDRRARSGSQR
jgi:hypothetical protein